MRFAILFTGLLIAGCEPHDTPPARQQRDLAGEVTRLEHELLDVRNELAATNLKLAGHYKALYYVTANIERLEYEISGNPAARYAHESTLYALQDLLREIDKPKPTPKKIGR